MDHSIPQPNTAAPVLTVNTRLARWLLLAHDERQRKAGLSAWPTPEILSLESWLRNAWINSWPEKYFLTALQSKILWQDILASDEETRNNPLLDRTGAAHHAADAYGILKQYRLNSSSPAFEWTEESRAFKRWMRRYEKRLKDMGALDAAETLDRVCEAMKAGNIPIPQALVLAGFEEITPQLANWIEFLESRRTQLTFDPEIPAPQPRPEQVSIRGYSHRQEEALQCARWVRSVYRPGRTLGIVVPQLEEYRALLDNELTAELAPGKIYPWVEEGKPFNISLGTPLAGEPLVRLALAFLGARTSTLAFHEFAEILTSPFFASGHEAAQDARALEQELRRKRVTRVDLGHTPQAMDAGKNPQLTEFIAAWHDHLQNNKAQRPRQWAEAFNTALEKAGWPGTSGTLAARGHQALAAWYKNLETLASLDRVMGRISRMDAAAALARLALEPEFQVKTPEQPIQVVGLLESAGMRFDHLWVMGCHAEALPGSPSPNPFLPVTLRKQHGLPRSSAARELEFAERSLSRLLAAAPNVVLSYPEWEGHTQIRMSPLLQPWRDLQPEAETRIETTHRHKDRLVKARLEFFEEPPALPVAGDEAARFAEPVRGGTSILRDFAACPFRAFAVHRLGVNLVELPEYDFDHPERGNLVHKALEMFWGEVKSKTRLAAFTDTDLRQKLGDCVTAALKDLAPWARQDRFFEIERERVTQLLFDWMQNIEMLRADFDVTGEEKKVALDLGGLKLSMRVDRIDRGVGGKTLVIDYKTGSAKPAGWFGERIQEPQLPLYAIKLAPDAVVFAQVRKGDMKLYAAGDSRPPLDTMRYEDIEKRSGCAGWPELLDRWRENLESTAGRFLAGENPVDPHARSICDYCGMESFCRIDARSEEDPVEREDV